MSLIAYVTRIHFADRVVEDALPEELRNLGILRPLILTDAAGEEEDLFDRVADALPQGLQPVPLRGVAPPLTRAAVARAASRAGDAVIGLGGPLALDLARLAGHAAQVPVIALPTTTANVGLGPVLVGPPAATPVLILCDPTLTTAAGAERTAAAGMDALTHCIEAYLGTTWNPPADGIALEGLRRACVWIDRAVSDGQNLEARREVLAAALNAGLATQKGLGGVHALAHALEAEAGLTDSHGMLHAALLPPVLSFNAPAVADRFEALAHAMRLSASEGVAGALSLLARRIGLPERLARLGLSEMALDRVARAAAEDPANRTNPRHATAADYRRLLEAAL